VVFKVGIWELTPMHNWWVLLKKITEWIDNQGYYFDNETDNWWIEFSQIILITDPAGWNNNVICQQVSLLCSLRYCIWLKSQRQQQLPEGGSERELGQSGDDQ